MITINGAAAGPGAGWTSAPVSKSFTVNAGTNRILIVGVHRGSPTGGGLTGAVTGVTYNGVAMTPFVAFTGTDRCALDCFYMVNPPVGTANVSASWTGNADFCLLSIICFNGVKQTGVPLGFGGQSGNYFGDTVTTVPVYVGGGYDPFNGVTVPAGSAGMVFGCYGDAASSGTTAQNPLVWTNTFIRQTMDYKNVSAPFTDIIAFSSYTLTALSNDRPTWDLTGASGNHWTIFEFIIEPAPATDGPRPPRRFTTFEHLPLINSQND